MDLPYEIVHVINARHLIDSESYQRALEAEQIGRLQPGFYVVLWPFRAAASRYDTGARFIGPYPTRHGAEQAQALMGAIMMVGGAPAPAPA